MFVGQMPLTVLMIGDDVRCDHTHFVQTTVSPFLLASLCLIVPIASIPRRVRCSEPNKNG
jgi:hypothetical protein